VGLHGAARSVRDVAGRRLDGHEFSSMPLRSVVVREAGGEEHAGHLVAVAGELYSVRAGSTSAPRAASSASSRRAVASASSPSESQVPRGSRGRTCPPRAGIGDEVACRGRRPPPPHRPGCRRYRARGGVGVSNVACTSEIVQPKTSVSSRRESRGLGVTHRRSADGIESIRRASALGTIDCRPSSSRERVAGRAALELRVGLCAHPEGVAGSSMN